MTNDNNWVASVGVDDIVAIRLHSSSIHGAKWPGMIWQDQKLVKRALKQCNPGNFRTSAGSSCNANRADDVT